MTQNPKVHGIKRLWNALHYSAQGFRATYHNEEAFRQECWATVILVPAALVLSDSGIEAALLISSIVFVMVVELLNTGIEAAVDRVGFEQHTLSGRAKDAGSAAVLLSLFLAFMTWLLVLLF
ncbi:MAG: diacylglycerol kinase [Gammaproteobacteria bacterium]|nr:diacylglycerol kinase [Gammaproteobacteria bacterium]